MRAGTWASLSRTLARDPECGASPYADLLQGGVWPFPHRSHGPCIFLSCDDDPRVILHLALAKATSYTCSRRLLLAIPPPWPAL